MKKQSAWRSLGFILWIVLSVFSVILIFLLLFSIYGLSKRELSVKMRQTFADTGDKIVSALETGGSAADIAYSAGVGGVYLVYEDRTVTVLAGEDKSGREFEDYLSVLSDSTPTAFFSAEEEFVYGRQVNLSGRRGDLFLTIPLAPIGGYQSRASLFSVVAALSAVVLSFAASGIVASLIARPVVELTECAKELTKGNYEVTVRKNYFFSEIAELAETLDGAKEEISASSRIQRELIANVSHDFRTPLTMIKAYASMIREISGDDKAKRDAHAQIIIEETDRLTELVEDVLDLSRIQSEAEQAVLFDLSEAVRSTMQRFDYLQETQGYRLEVLVEDGAWIRADRTRIVQVIYNLVGNAVNYTGEDKRVRVKLQRKGTFARLEVIDSGKGIPPEEQATIWDRYYRSAKTHKRPVRGTGLGLSIVKSVLLSHRIPFGVISEVGKGSCFWVEFPLAEREEGGMEQ